MGDNSVGQVKRRTLSSWPFLVVLNLLVALTGYLKDVSVAAYLGTSSAGDAFTTAYFIVDLVGVLALGNAVGLAAAAVFGTIAHQDKDSLGWFVRRASWAVVACSVAVGLVLLVCRGPVLHPFILHNQAYHTMNLLYLVFLPTVIFYPIFYFFSGALQATGRYALSVGAPCVLNVVVTLTGFVLLHMHLPVDQGSVVLGLSIPASSAVLAILMVTSWAKERSAYRKPKTGGSPASHSTKRGTSPAFDFPEVEVEDPAMVTSLTKLLRNLFRIIVSYGTYLLLLQGLGLVERYVVSVSMPSGSLAAMTYANRLGQIPNWVFMSAVATWLIPHLVRAKESRDYEGLISMVRQAIVLGVYVALPMTIVFFILRVPIVAVLFQHGRFDSTSTVQTAAFLSGYALAMTFQSLSALLFRVVIATSQMRRPIIYAFVGVVTSGLAMVLLVPHLGAFAIGLSEAVGSLVTTALLWRTFHNYTHGKIIFPQNEGKMLILSNIAVFALSIAVRYIYFEDILSQPSSVQFVLLVAAVAGIFVVYGALVFREEILRLWGRV